MCGTFCGARDDEAEVRGIFVAGETIRRGSAGYFCGVATLVGLHLLPFPSRHMATRGSYTWKLHVESWHKRVTLLGMPHLCAPVWLGCP